MAHLLLAAAGAGALTAVLAVALILGYVAIWAIWHFGFRGRDEEGRRVEKRDDDG